MSTLRIFTTLGTDDGSYAEPVTYPVQVMDEEGALIAETAASQVVQTVDVPDELKKVFVRAFLPSGEKQTKTFELLAGSTIDVQFFTERVSPHEWLAWSRPHIALQGLNELRSFEADFEDMWLRTWIWSQ